MRAYVRSVLVVFAAFELVLGVWLTFFPRAFYDDVPTVDWTPSIALAVALALSVLVPASALAAVRTGRKVT